MQQPLKNNPLGSGGKKPRFAFSMYWMYAIIIIILVGMLYVDQSTQTEEKDYSEFKEILASGGVTSITIHNNKQVAEAELNNAAAKKYFKNFI